MNLRYLFYSFFIFTFYFVKAQETFPVNGVADNRPEKYLFINAKIIQDYKSDTILGSLLIEKGKIIKIVKGKIDEIGATIIDLNGKYIYPSFIDLYSQYGITPNDKKNNNGYPQFISNKQGAYGWNEAIKSEYKSNENFRANKTSAQSYIENGFSVVLTHNMDGIVRGSATLVTLTNNKRENEAIINGNAANFMSFDKGTSDQDYPNSLMGSIALLRQTYYDAEWYKKQNRESNISLERFNDLQSLPQFFNTSSWQDIFRAKKIADEFGKKYIYVGNGDEYQQIEALKKLNVSIVVPIDFPKAFDVEDAYDATKISINQLKNWELAPYNFKFLQDANIDFAITSTGLKEPKYFIKNIQKAIKCGASVQTILKALTTTPAKLIQQDSILGSVTVGKMANLLITDKPIFQEGFSIYQNWTNGQLNELKAIDEIAIQQNYLLNYDDRTDTLKVDFSSAKNEAYIRHDSLLIKADFEYTNKQVAIQFQLPDKDKNHGYLRLRGWQSRNNFVGSGILPNGKTIDWSATAIPQITKIDTTKNLSKFDSSLLKIPTTVTYPFVAYGWTKKPIAQKILFKNATVWTNEQDGILQNTDVLIENGKIIKIGKNISDNTAKIVDATGKHLTAGIIDEHSHICISGNVNECSEVNTSEVKIGDVIDNQDINMYRQLAGGVVAAQLLHGSCNPIGGQSALIKFRWGSLPDELKIENADGFIKFALGENPKESNWGDKQTQRYPQSRMGVEQVYIDNFTRAKEYANNPLARKNLKLDALVEILNKKRFISCHSYVQSEITMLMRVAEKFNFRINTFTHILEGYKVADKMKKHGVGASTFADWWAYKMEVMQAIPYNAAILNKVGIITAINSDDAEMGRRLNQEAGKIVKYGNVSEEDAWKMVTLNPAKLLHLDNKIGSIKVGKDADVVLWSGNPLSNFSIALQTYVDGIKYYDREEDILLQEEIQQEKSRIIQKMITEKKAGTQTQPVIIKSQPSYHCDDFGIYHELIKY